MHELSRYCTYFPLQKVIPFFERIILSESPQPQLLDVSVKKYTDIAFKNEEMAVYRKDIVLRFLEKLKGKDIALGVKVITAIFEGVSERNKYDLYEIVN